MKFAVQLKGTDTEPLVEALAVRLAVPSLEYLRNSGLPALLVVYHAPSRCLFARWIHRFRERFAASTQSTVTLRLTEADELNELVVGEWATDAQQWQDWQLGLVQRPLRVTVQVHDQLMASGRLSLAIRSRLDGFHGDVLLTSNQQQAQVSVRLLPGGLEVHAPTGAALYWEGHPTTSLDVAVLAGDVLLAVAHCVGSARQLALASRLASAALTQASPLGAHATGALVELFLSAGDANKALDLFRDAEDLAQDMAFLVITKSRAQLDAQAQERFSLLLEETVIRQPSGGARAARAFTVGSHSRSLGNHNQALKYFRIAAKEDPSYLGRDYFLEYMAGVHFQAGHFRTAVSYYQRAILAGATNLTALLADFYLLAGWYWRAYEMLYSVFSGERIRGYSFAVLQLHFLERAFSLMPLDHQERDPGAALDMVADCGDEVSDQVPEWFLSTLALDLLCPLAWFNLGVWAFKQGDTGLARDAFLGAALIQCGDGEAWGNAMLLSVQLAEPHIGLLVVEALTQTGGANAVKAVVEVVEAQPPGFPAEAFLGLLDGALERASSEAEVTTVRFWGEDGTDELWAEAKF